MKVRWVSAMCGAIVLVSAAPAHALKAYVNYDSLVVAAAPGEKNNVTILNDPAGGGPSPFMIIEAGTGNTQTTVGPGCTKALRVIRCEFSEDYPVPSLSLSLGDLNDVAAVSGGFYYQQVSAGGGDDNVDLSQSYAWGYSGGWITGGAGNDTLDTANGSFDNVDCGPGADTLSADDIDYVYSCR